MTNADAPLAEFCRLCFRYPSHSSDLLNDVNLSIHPGQVVMVAGPNGTGKSTLLGLLSGRLRPTGGTVCVFGRDPSTATRKPELGLVTEPFHPDQSPLPVDLTVQQILTWLSVLDGVTDESIDEALDELELDRSLLGQPIHLLSKGERQRVILLVVLLRRPQVILADEPLEGLDRQSRRPIGRCLHRYAHDQSRGIVWVSHHLSETLQYADRLVEIVDRRVIERRPDRYMVRIEAGAGRDKAIRIASLHSLAGLVNEAFDGQGIVRLEIREAASSEGSQ